jgi:hypothetical protein
MGWKNLLCAVLVGALASGAFGAPSVWVNSFASTSTLDSAGNWIWDIGIAPSNPVPTGSTPLNVELGFAEVSPTGQLLSARKLSTGPGDDFYIDKPGEVIFGWETTQDVDPGPGIDLKAVGLQVNTDADQVFSALGSQVYTTSSPKGYIEIKTLGPCIDPYNAPGSSCAGGDRLTSTIVWLGAYDGNGRINERNPDPPPTTLNYDTYSGAATLRAHQGDANFDDSVDGLDYGHILFGNDTTWLSGDFNDDDSVDGLDYNIWLFAPEVRGSGAHSGTDAPIPEPGSAALAAVAFFVIAIFTHSWR